MTPETARNNFDRALRDEMAGNERAEFERLLESDATLCAEFETYADSRGGADLRAIDQWLRSAGETAARQRPMIQPGLAESVALAAQGRRRGRLVRVAFGVAAVAAAAAITFVVILPRDSAQPGPSQPTGWPSEQAGSVAMLADNARQFEKAMEFAPLTGVKVEVGNGALLRPTVEGLELIEGELKATLDSAVKYEVRVGNHRVSATGPAEFSAKVRAEGFAPHPHPAARPGLLARFGGMSFELTVSAVEGQASVKVGETDSPVAEGKTQVFKVDDDRKPPKPEELFGELDADNDGKLTKEEAAARMIQDFDDNKDGSVSLDEFKANWRPFPGPRAEEAFRRMDRNKDGKLDDVEADQRMIDDFDDDASGFVEMPEFRRHFRPLAGDGPRPPREGGPDGRRPPREGGPEGPRPPREGGPDGPRPPREGGLDGPRPPREGGPDGPRPPRGPEPR